MKDSTVTLLLLVIFLLPGCQTYRDQASPAGPHALLKLEPFKSGLIDTKYRLYSINGKRVHHPKKGNGSALRISPGIHTVVFEREITQYEKQEYPSRDVGELLIGLAGIAGLAGGGGSIPDSTQKQIHEIKYYTNQVSFLAGNTYVSNGSAVSLVEGDSRE